MSRQFVMLRNYFLPAPQGPCGYHHVEYSNSIRVGDPEMTKKPLAERAFRKTHDSTDYVDWSKAQRVSFSNLKRSTHFISLRLRCGSTILTFRNLTAAAVSRGVSQQGGPIDRGLAA